MLAIIHGWSDTSDSFERLARRLTQELPDRPIAHIRMGNYVSMDDRVTFDDLTQALQRAWEDPGNGLAREHRSVDVIVHSTGALVVRDWMTRLHKPDNTPVRRLVMLGAANFGSHLAHKGRSFAGRIIKGLNKRRTDNIRNGPRFHTGAKILEGLELASAYSRRLAERDRFGDEVWYGPGRVLCTSIVGSTGYSNIAAAANEPGSDGTVRVGTANLNPVRATLDFATKPAEPTVEIKHPNGLTAFARINSENHSTVALKQNGPRDATTIETIKAALRVTDDEFTDFAAELETRNNAKRNAGSRRKQTQPYQNTVVRVRDQFDSPVEDYFLELFAKHLPRGHTPAQPITPAQDRKLRVHSKNTEYLQDKVLGSVHTNRLDPSSRGFMINTKQLFSRFGPETNRSLYIALTAMPEITETRSVGYRTLEYNDIGSVRVDPDRLATLFAPDRTAFINIIIRREQDPRLFTFDTLDD